LEHRLENTHAAVGAAEVEPVRRARMNVEGERRGSGQNRRVRGITDEVSYQPPFCPETMNHSRDGAPNSV
jgi:hypothetical protein